MADTRIMVFSSQGNFIREFGWKSLRSYSLEGGLLRGRAGKAFLFRGTEEGTCTDALVVRSISISLSLMWCHDALHCVQSFGGFSFSECGTICINYREMRQGCG